MKAWSAFSPTNQKQVEELKTRPVRRQPPRRSKNCCWNSCEIRIMRPAISQLPTALCSRLCGSAVGSSGPMASQYRPWGRRTKMRRRKTAKLAPDRNTGFDLRSAARLGAIRYRVWCPAIAASGSQRLSTCCFRHWSFDPKRLRRCWNSTPRAAAAASWPGFLELASRGGFRRS
jgi:hypothetical protein